MKSLFCAAVLAGVAFGASAPVREVTTEVPLAGGDDIAADSDDTFAVAVKSGIALLDSGGIQTGYIESPNFLPWHLVITEDRSIWVAGVEAPGRDYMVLRKYSREGELLGSYPSAIT